MIGFSRLIERGEVELLLAYHSITSEVAPTHSLADNHPLSDVRFEWELEFRFVDL